MAFVENPELMLKEFALDFTTVADGKTVPFKALLDDDDRYVEQSGTRSKSTDYIITFITAKVTLIRGQVVKQGNRTFKLREPAMKLDDGVFSEAYLEQTAN